MNTYRVIVFDPQTGQLTEKHIRREWRAIANELGCDYIEHAQRFGLHFWCDEEGLLKDNLLGMVCSIRFYADGSAEISDAIMGRLVFIGGFDNDGNDLPVTDEQIARIREIPIIRGRDFFFLCPDFTRMRNNNIN